MAEPLSLTNQALGRLRKLAAGNGLDPAQIEIIEAQEQIYTLQGVAQLVPFVERLPTAPKGAKRITLPNRAALHEEAQRRQRAFLDGRDWITAAIADMRGAPGEGWGYDGARINLPDSSVVLAAADPCPRCQGQRMLPCPQCHAQGFVVCPTCQGRGQEVCYNCSGTGQSPTQPGQPCVVCQGKRYAPCRFCRSTGKLSCPTCQGRRGTPCPTCQGRGKIVEEIALACGATVGFRIKSDNIPSGLRRGLDRIGMMNLPKGHADIKCLGGDEEDAKHGKDEKPQPPKPELLYQAMLPYADIKLRFGADSRAVMVSAFGKRGALLGVPSFLDEALAPWLQKLEQAARGTAPLDPALEARAVREALALDLEGRGQLKELRRLYPVGLSPAVAEGILADTKAALHSATRHIRIAAAAAGVVIGAGLFASAFLTPLHAEIAGGMAPAAQALLDFVLLALPCALGWLALGAAMQMKLKRRFPELKIAFRSDPGHIGYAMFAAMAAAWVAVLLLAPAKPAWLMLIGLAKL